jgi:hypothetical protein
MGPAWRKNQLKKLLMISACLALAFILRIGHSPITMRQDTAGMPVTLILYLFLLAILCPHGNRWKKF